MDFYERYELLCAEKGLKPQEKKMRNLFNVSASTIGAWKTRGTIPRTELLCQIADYFDVSIDYLLGRTDIRQSHKSVSDSGSASAEELLGEDASADDSRSQDTADQDRGQNLPAYSDDEEDGDETPGNISSLHSFNAEERFLVDIYRKVGVEGRVRINQAVMNIYDEYAEQKKEAAVSVS